MLFRILFLFFFSLQVSAAMPGFPICESNQNCPGWMAQLVTPFSSVCSSFLIKPDLMMTNRHCLPSSMFKAGGSCAGIEFHFPTTPQYNSEKADCETVIGTSEVLSTPARWISDFAILKLKKPLTRTVLEVSEAPIQYLEAVQIFKMDPAPMGKNTPVLKKITCEKASPLANMFFTQAPSPELTLKKCPIIQGNSGSPILNSKGKAVGIIWGTGTPLTAPADNLNSQFGLGNPFECLKFSTTSPPQLNGICKTDLPAKVLSALEQDYKTGRHESPDKTEQKTRLAQKMNESFALLQEKFKKEMEKPEGAESRALFAWIAQEIPLKSFERKEFLWGRYMTMPSCVNRNYLEKYAEAKGLSKERFRAEISVPMANLIRVTGEPELYFTPLLEAKNFVVSADLSQQNESQALKLSYQVEVGPNHIELQRMEIPNCAAK